MKTRRKLFRATPQQIVRGYNSENSGATLPQPVTAAIRLWYNPSRSSQMFYGPGIYVLALSLFPPLLATLAMSKEGEQKTILQVYVSNISAHEFSAPAKSPRLWLWPQRKQIIPLMMILFMGFGLHLRGRSDAVSCGHNLALGYMFTVTAFGNMIGRGDSQPGGRDASGCYRRIPARVHAVRLALPSVENIPAGSIRWISNIVWGRYYIEVVRDALLAGGGWPSVWLKVIAIAVIGIFFYIIAWRTMRRMQLKD